MSSTHRSLLSYQILEQIASGQQVSQRSLARQAGVALGLAHGLIHRMVGLGWMRIERGRGNRVRYRITRAGLAERERCSRTVLADHLRYYAQARRRVAERLAALSQGDLFKPRSKKRVVFYGASDLAEIGYVCLQQSDLQLVGVVDEPAGGRFFGFLVRGLEALTPETLDRVPFDALVIMSVDDRRAVRRRLQRVGYPQRRAFWI